VIDNRAQRQSQRQLEQSRDSRGSKFANSPPAMSTSRGNIDGRWEEPSRWLEENIKPSGYIGGHPDIQRLDLMSPRCGHHPATPEELQRSVGDSTSESAVTYQSNRTSSLTPYLEMMVASRSRNPVAPARSKKQRHKPAKPRAQCLERSKGGSQVAHEDGAIVKLSPPARVIQRGNNLPKLFPKSDSEHGIKSQAEVAKAAEREALFSRLIFPRDGYKE